jgi:hypothetical protein
MSKARTVFSYTVLSALCFCIAYDREPGMHGPGGLVLLSILSVFGALIVGLLVFSGYEETVTRQAQQIDRQAKQIDKQADQIRELQAKNEKDEKWNRIFGIRDTLDLILNPKEIGPYGYSFAQYRKMGEMIVRGVNVNEIGATLGMDSDILQFVVATRRLFESGCDWMTAWSEAEKRYDRVQEKFASDRK